MNTRIMLYYVYPNARQEEKDEMIWASFDWEVTNEQEWNSEEEKQKTSTKDVLTELKQKRNKIEQKITKQKNRSLRKLAHLKRLTMASIYLIWWLYMYLKFIYSRVEQ
jgi:hypothetical protein